MQCAIWLVVVVVEAFVACYLLLSPTATLPKMATGEVSLCHLLARTFYQRKGFLGIK